MCKSEPIKNFYFKIFIIEDSQVLNLQKYSQQRDNKPQLNKRKKKMPKTPEEM